MRTIYKILFTLIVAIAPACLYAQSSQADAYSLEMDKMLKAVNTKEVMIETVASSWKAMQLPLTDYDAAATAVIDAIWPDLVQDYITEYKKYFTLDDMKAINRFYATPTGEKFGKYSGAMSAAIRSTITQKYSATIQQIIMKYIKK